MAFSFALRLRQLRVAARLTPYRLAKLSGLSRQAVSLLEQGKRQPTLETCSKLAQGLGIGLDVLLEGYIVPYVPEQPKGKKGGK
jgi:transcriptional regulator with XRE-family HTH domain